MLALKWLTFVALAAFAGYAITHFVRDRKRSRSSDVDLQMALDSAGHYYEPPGRKTP
jgi:hypothetical protein